MSQRKCPSCGAMQQAKSKFCSECGSQIKDKNFVYEDFMEYVSGLHCTTCDSYGDAEYAADRNLTWWPYWIEDFIGTPKEEVICILENAEVVILEALLEAKPELRSEDEDDDLSYAGDWEKFKNEEQPNYR